MIKKLLFILILFVHTLVSFCQETEVKTDSSSVEKPSKLEISIL